VASFYETEQTRQLVLVCNNPTSIIYMC
jgi:hypothetical protein